MQRRAARRTLMRERGDLGAIVRVVVVDGVGNREFIGENGEVRGGHVKNEMVRHE